MNPLLAAKKRKIDYASIISRIEKHTRFHHESRFNVVVPIFKRPEKILPCINYLQHSAKIARFPINIMFVEHDDQPYSKEKVLSKNCSYVYIYKSDQDSFNKCLCFNLGFKIYNNEKWTLFHDCDILVTPDFVDKIELKSHNTNKGWIQPYSSRRVIYLDESFTKTIEKNPEEIMDLKSIKNHPLVRHGIPGAPGGTIFVKNSAFKQVGGYDPELFFGYSPEDSFFWSKLESLYGHVNEMKQCHYRYAEYMNDLDVYHLEHPPSWAKKRTALEKNADNYLKIFWKMPNFDKKQFLSVCRGAFV